MLPIPETQALDPTVMTAVKCAMRASHTLTADETPPRQVHDPMCTGRTSELGVAAAKSALCNRFVSGSAIKNSVRAPYTAIRYSK